MSLIVSGKQYTPAPEGMHQAVCVDVVDLGIVETAFGKKRKVKVVWELAAQMEDDKPFMISKRYTPSLHEKAALHKDLKSWRGRAFTPEELAGFDLENVVGVGCQILVQHEDKDGVTYGNIQAITKADKASWLKPSGKYTRVKDRPDAGNGNGNGHDVNESEEAPF